MKRKHLRSKEVRKGDTGITTVSPDELLGISIPTYTKEVLNLYGFTDESGNKSIGDSSVVVLSTTKKTRKLPKSRGGKQIVYLIDADTHAYRAASATDGSTWEVVDYQGKIHQFKYKKEADTFSKGLINPFTITQQWYPEPPSHALKIMKEYFSLFDDLDIELYVTGKSNFRYNIIKNYKGNRSGRKPANLGVCKDYLIEIGGIQHSNLEADDLVIIGAKELDKLGIPWTIVGCDKDLKQIPGHFYDPFKDELCTVSMEEARVNLWKQIATGDRTDNIISPKGLGPKTFDKHFSDFDWTNDSDFDALIEMVSLYKSKEKQRDGESDEEYTKRILMWIKTVASLVFLRRGVDEPYQLPNKAGKINRNRR